MAGWEVETSFVHKWLLSLDERSYELVVAALELLAEIGPGLGRPLVDTVAGSRHRNMKELRPGSRGNSELRVLFAFEDRKSVV